MPERDELVHEAADLLVLYRDLSKQTTTADGLDGVSAGLARALEELDGRATKDSLDNAARELATVREILWSVRRSLGN